VADILQPSNVNMTSTGVWKLEQHCYPGLMIRTGYWKFVCIMIQKILKLYSDKEL
jgi:hypothetical protein